MQIRASSCADDTKEQPLELLFACHERIRRFTGLTDRLAQHVSSKGADAEAQQAATNILRYFTEALPRHHEDEELDVFPALRTLGDPRVNVAIDRLQSEHAHLDLLWSGLEPWLRQIAGGEPQLPPALLPDFVSAYPAHVGHEEREIFTALDQLSAQQLAEIAASMRARRGDKSAA